MNVLFSSTILTVLTAHVLGLSILLALQLTVRKFIRVPHPRDARPPFALARPQGNT